MLGCATLVVASSEGVYRFIGLQAGGRRHGTCLACLVLVLYAAAPSPFLGKTSDIGASELVISPESAEGLMNL